MRLSDPPADAASIEQQLPERVPLDSCWKPDLMDSGQCLPWGTTFACDHFVWTVYMAQQWGGEVIPAWAAVSLANA